MEKQKKMINFMTYKMKKPEASKVRIEAKHYAKME